MNAPSWADLLLLNLGRSRDRAEPLGSLQERLGAPRRALEAAVQELRLRGVAVASGSEGVWLGDAADMRATYQQLRHRITSQVVTSWAVRRTARRLAAGDVIQETLGLVA